jgi:hypothetical protein
MPFYIINGTQSYINITNSILYNEKALNGKIEYKIVFSLLIKYYSDLINEK